MKDQVNLEDYKKQVKDCLIKTFYRTEEEAERLIQENLDEFEWFIESGLTPMNMAGVISSFLW